MKIGGHIYSFNLLLTIFYLQINERFYIFNTSSNALINIFYIDITIFIIKIL